MNSNWIKEGILFRPQGQSGWMNSHAQVPTLLVKADEGVVRVYFSSRPRPGLTRIAYVDLAMDNLKTIRNISAEPLLPLGRPGTFDEHGTMPSSVVEKDGIVYLYYSGWQRAVGVPYNNYTGVAISHDGGKTFEKVQEAPVLDRNSKELYSATSPCVIHDGDHWHMWYCSGTHWHSIGDKLEHTYDIKYAYSSDGIQWHQTGIVCISQNDEYEAITKPAVIKHGSCYYMWFCYRGSLDFRDGKEGYRIGFAYSSDAKNWTRDDSRAGISVSEEGWDSKMIAYPEVKHLGEEILMLYNGNSFGTDGFGLARLPMEELKKYQN